MESYIAKEKGVSKENIWVDIVKVLCAVVVVAGHCYFWEIEYIRWWSLFVNSCVQILFVFSGYYVFKNGTLRNDETARKYIGRLVLMYLCWQGIYFLHTMYYFDKTNPGWFMSLVYQTTETFDALNSGHLWYIQNLILVITVLYGLHKNEFSKKEVLIWLLLAMVTHGRMLRAFAGVIFGAYLAQGESVMSQRKKCVGMLTASVGALVLMIAACYVSFGNDIDSIIQRLMMYIFVMTFTCGVLHMKNIEVCRMNQMAYYVRKLSTAIYLVHMLFIQKGIEWASAYALWGENKFFFWTSFYVVIASIVFSVILILLSKCKPFAWLKKII